MAKKNPRLKVQQQDPDKTDIMQINIDERDKDGNIVRKHGTVQMRANIFRKAKWENKYLWRVKYWLRTRIDNSMHEKKRYRFIHKHLKEHIVHTAIRFLRWYTRKYLVRYDSDIAPHWYNNHLRIRRWAMHMGLEDMWKKMVYVQGLTMLNGKSAPQTYKNADSNFYYGIHRKKHRSNESRRFMIDMWITEILEDTADREWLNFGMLRECRAMMELYGVNEEEMKKVPLPGEYPVYMAVTAYDNAYFGNNAWRPVWHPADSEVPVIDKEQGKKLKEIKKLEKQLLKEDKILSKCSGTAFFKKKKKELMKNGKHNKTEVPGR